MDDLVFNDSLIERDQVDMRVECFSLCYRRELCNLVLYNHLASKCRLYTEAFGSISDGTVDAGWQYYGISCANFRLGNAHSDVDVINTIPKDVCNSNIIDDSISYCYTGASWEVVPVKCVPCHKGRPRHYTYPNTGHIEELTFDLVAGMNLKLEVSGYITNNNLVIFRNPTMDELYILCLRWYTTPTSAIFNTRHIGLYGAEERLYGVSVRNISNYNIEIHISQSIFKTYVDGALWMTNQMRLPFVDVRSVQLRGFTALHSFHIGYETC